MIPPLTRTAVLNVVGLSRRCLEKMPFLSQWAKEREVSSFAPEFPAVTCTAQSTYLTGRSVWGEEGHGIVGNGWYDADLAEVRFWRQPNGLVRAEKIWERLKREYGAQFSCGQLFWWYNMYSQADWTMTPRPLYPADGRKVFDIHTQPMGMREEVKAALGDFPFASFWGPKAGIASSAWIAKAAQWLEEKESPTLNLVYLPHLDYCLQKVGPEGAGVQKELALLDEVLKELISFFEKRGVEVLVLSEYGISPVSKPVSLNRLFREKGWLSLKHELGREMLDAGSSRVFAVADHQVAHIYVQDKSLKAEVKALLEATDGVDEVREVPEGGAGAVRAGDFMAVADEEAWFAYYFWQEDTLAPDYARTIDIHRKPGYDPLELFIDPSLRFPLFSIAKFLLKKKLGFRGLMEIIPLTPSLVKGSHGRDCVREEEQPLFIAPKSSSLRGKEKLSSAQEVFGRIYHQVTGREA